MDTAKHQDALGNDASGRTLAEIVLQTINSIVLVANGRGEILYASPSTRTILGYDPQELLGMGYWEIASPDPEARKKHLKKIAAVARGEEPAPEAPYAVKMLTKQGEERWILWRDAKGSDDLVVGAGQDITELRRTQEELRRREEEISAVFERANDGMLVVDRDFRYMDANPAACELFGLGKADRWKAGGLDHAQRNRDRSSSGAHGADGRGYGRNRVSACGWPKKETGVQDHCEYPAGVSSRHRS